MKQLTEKMIEVAEAGKRSVLCTVLASSGSAPRGAGARMLVCEDGAVRDKSTPLLDRIRAHPRSVCICVQETREPECLRRAARLLAAE